MSIESTDLSLLPDWLRRELANRTLEDRSVHRPYAPRYAYGRHRGPALRSAHRASVMISLLPGKSGTWQIPLTLRPSQMADHGGQISLPGGRSESGESEWRTACREYGEELGCSTEYLQPLGQLSPLYVFASKHSVTPMVSVSSLKPKINPNPDEVAAVIYLSVEQLLSDECMRIGTLRRGNSEFDAPGFQVDGHFVWGATAMILGEFRETIRRILRDNSTEPWFM